jgi:Mrp family chromosome partitioning ATPase
MFMPAKKKTLSGEYGTPVTVHVSAAALERTFDTTIVNSFRHMATELACNGGIPRIIALSSALRGEGVTYTTLAFGATLASDLNARICVVDLNWWAPSLLGQLVPAAGSASVQKSFTGGSRPGLAQVLLNKLALDDALVTTDKPNLTLLPAGELSAELRPTLARSDALRELLDELAGRYDHLLLDVPAILATSDAISLISLSDACVLVVRHGITPVQSVKQALDDVRNHRMLGVVLNQVTIRTPRWIRALIPGA